MLKSLALALGILSLLLAPAVYAGEPKPDAVAELVIKKRALVGKNTFRVTQGQTVELRWSADEAVELHLHGYDVLANVKPDAPAVMRFKAHATGRYPVTVHGFGGTHSHGGGHSEKTMLYLEVYPN